MTRWAAEARTASAQAKPAGTAPVAVRVAHLFDAAAGWEQRVAAQQLLAHSPARFDSSVILVDAAARRAMGSVAQGAALVARRRGLGLMAAPTLAGTLRDRSIDLVHAWGLSAAAFAGMPGLRPIVLSWFEPAISDRDARLLRTLESRKLAIACASGTVRRRLIERGVAPEVCVVVRPGVDFGIINRAKRSDLRRQLGLDWSHHVLIAPEPATRAGGHFVLFWTAAIRSFVEPHVRVILPGESDEQRRIARLARRIGFEQYLLCPGAAVPFEELISISDMLVVASEGEVSTTAIAWAFAAGVPVIATAVHATAELVANKVNGLLLKPQPQTRMAARIASLLEDRAALAKVRETARGQAFEVFSVRRYCDQMARLYENLLAGRPAGDGITDAAFSS